MKTYLMLFAAVAAVGCGATYTADDSAANAIAARHEADTLDICALGSEDAGTCTPAAVRAHAALAFCANQRELTAHADPYDGGVPCQPKR